MSEPEQPHHHDGAPPAGFSLGGMLLKLVLLPGLVVLVLVAVVVLIGWLALPGGDVESLVEVLAQEGNARWPAAVNLAAALHEAGNASVKRDPAVARRLSAILQRELESGRMDLDHVRLRMYLCRLLGEFYVADPLPALLEAARLQRSAEEVEVRRSAVEAIAVLASHVGEAELRSDPQLIPVLLEAAEDDHQHLREAAAFALGVVGGEQAQACLEGMLSDGAAEVRYNAATGLARHGNPQCIGVLREMLDPDEAGPRRAMIAVNALRATGKLAAANPTADLGELAEAIERLSQADVAAAVRAKAVEVLRQLDRAKRTGDPSRP